ncbi:MAG: bifunctional riboflavin kinase/FAD synthetase [Ignavibacteriaceae bacterium]|nr:bifunctional riboflavin kinase/FAD synthetase [Ignavibacteriaceae bacterium]
MEIFSDRGNLVYDKNTIVTVGTFDGVHQGHRQIISKLNDEKKRNGFRTVIVTFDPHPQVVLKKRESDIRLLTTTEEKLRHFKELGLDAVYIINFTKEFSQTSADDFYKEYLIRDLGLSELVLGFDHMFGKNREGNFETLKSLSEEYGFKVIKIEEYKVDEERLSSSSIRKFISDGNITEANKLLGYPYSIEGIVIQGNRRGTEFGFPTANLQVQSNIKLIPKNGIYAVEITIDNENYFGMMSIGTNPTVTDDNFIKVEVNIFEFNRQIYGEQLRIHFVERIRDEFRFNSIDNLIKEIKNDKKRVLEIFNTNKQL